MRRVFVASVVAHLLVFACILHTRPRPAVASAMPIPVSDSDVITLDVADDPPAPLPRAAPARAAVAMVNRTTRASETARGTPTTPTPEADLAPDAAPYAQSGTIVVFAPNVGLSGFGAANPFLARNALPRPAESSGSAESRTRAAPSADAFYVPENKRAEQSVRDALRARDQSIGLGMEGPVVHALEDATHAGFAPAHGMATFMAVIDERGIVIDLRVLSMSDRDSLAAKRGWDDVRARAVRSLATAKIDLRGVKHAALKIEVSSDVLMASGSDPNRKVVMTGDRKRTVLETNAPGSPGGADVVESREIAKFDVTDLAGKPQRVVHAKLVMLVTR